jgi:predicted transcriptional regulator
LENIERIVKLKKIIEGTEAEHIIEYVKKNPGTTREKVAKQLQKEKICSRLTTLKVIERLLTIGMLIDQRKGRYFHSLYYNKDYDFSEQGIKLLGELLDEIKNVWRGLSEDEQYDKLFDELKGYTIRFKPKRRSKADNEGEK